jgi:sugar phosphate isomerase/epimerase
MKRRKFLINTSLSTAGLATGIIGCSPQRRQKQDEVLAVSEVEVEPFFKLSLAQWSLHQSIYDNTIDPMDFALKAKGWGFEGIEFVNHLYNRELEKYDSLVSGWNNLVNELNKRSDDNGIENLVMMVDLPEDSHLAYLDKGKRKKAVEDHYPFVDATAGLGCHSMRVNMFGEQEVERWKEASVLSLTTLSEYAAQQNVNIIVENHGSFTSNGALLAEVMKEVNMENCGTLPDFGNFCIRGERDEAGNFNCFDAYDRYKGVEELMPFAKAVSAKSYDFDNRGNETTIDYPKMLKIVKNAGYNGYIGVEYEGKNIGEVEGILATKNLLMNSLKKSG